MAEHPRIPRFHGAHAPMIAGFVSFFITGCAIIIITLIFTETLLTTPLSAGVSLVFWQSFSIGLLFFGILLILLGILIEMRLMRQSRHFTKILIEKAEKGFFDIPPEFSPKSGGSPSVGRELRVIRPESKRIEPSGQEIPEAPKIAPVSPVKAVSPPSVSTPSIPPPTAVSTPITMTLDEAVQSIVTRYNTEKVKKTFQGWNNTLMISFRDINKSYLYKINGDQGLVFSEGVDDTAAVQVKMDSTTFIKMLTKQINPIKAYSSGGLEVKGEMKNMLKLRQLMF